MAIERSREVTRMLRRVAAGTLACLLGATALAGCAPPDPPTATPTPTAIFASEDEALAAATDVYQRYLAVSDNVSASGGTGEERLKKFISDGYWPTEAASIESLRESGARTKGSSAFDNAELIELSEAMGTVTIRLCADVSMVRIIDSSGKDITPSERPDRVPLELEFSAGTGNEEALVIARSDVWSDTEYC